MKRLFFSIIILIYCTHTIQKPSGNTVLYFNLLKTIKANGLLYYEDPQNRYTFICNVAIDKTKKRFRIDLINAISSDTFASIIMSNNTIKIIMPMQKVVYTATFKEFNLNTISRVNLKPIDIYNVISGDKYESKYTRLDNNKIVWNKLIYGILEDNKLKKVVNKKAGYIISYLRYRKKSNIYIPTKFVFYYPKYKVKAKLGLLENKIIINTPINKKMFDKNTNNYREVKL